VDVILTCASRIGAAQRSPAAPSPCSLSSASARLRESAGTYCERLECHGHSPQICRGPGALCPALGESSTRAPIALYTALANALGRCQVSVPSPMRTRHIRPRPATPRSTGLNRRHVEEWWGIL